MSKPDLLRTPAASLKNLDGFFNVFNGFKNETNCVNGYWSSGINLFAFPNFISYVIKSRISFFCILYCFLYHNQSPITFFAPLLARRWDPCPLPHATSATILLWTYGTAKLYLSMCSFKQPPWVRNKHHRGNTLSKSGIILVFFVVFSAMSHIKRVLPFESIINIYPRIRLMISK